MKKYDDLVALELEGVEAEKSGDFANRKLYVMQGRPGRLYRRLYRPKKGEFAPEAAVEAVCNGVLQVFLPAPEIDQELAEAGFTSHNHDLASEFMGAIMDRLGGRRAEAAPMLHDLVRDVAPVTPMEPGDTSEDAGDPVVVGATQDDDEF